MIHNIQSSNGTVLAAAAEEAVFGASTAGVDDSKVGLEDDASSASLFVFEVTMVMYPLLGDVPDIGVFVASTDGISVGMGTGGIIGEFSQSGLVSSRSKHSHPLTTP